MRHARHGGFSLIECTAYLALFSLILGMAFMGFYRAHENTTRLHRNTADILRALQAGERWRADVRSAGGPPQWQRVEAGQVLRLPRAPGASGEVSYAFRDDAIWRQALPNTNWLPVLAATANSEMRPEPRRHVTAWRWDVELKGRARAGGARPIFSFTAARPETGTP